MRKGPMPAHFLTTEPKWGPIGPTVYKRSYSQNKSKITDEKEIWAETAVRTVDGNLSLVDEKFIETDEREKLLNLLFPFDILPAGRHLSSSGREGRQFIFNCHSSGWDVKEPQAHFTFLFDQLMQGGGVGANYSDRYLEKMPVLRHSIDLHIVCDQSHPDHHEFAHLLSVPNKDEERIILRVHDSREGWVGSVNLPMLMSFDVDHRWETQKPITIEIDVSDIRRRGSLLVTSGGIACGPGPLVVMLSDLVKQLNSCVGRQLTWEDALVLDHTLASCVIAGGKRRSSRMSVKNWKDKGIFEFINVKREDGSHWTTNISVEIDDDFLISYKEQGPTGDWARRVMKAVVLGKRLNGEPGLWNRSLAMKGEREPELMYCPNPCGEIGLQMWENCCLGHVNLEHFAQRSQASALEAFRLMTRFLIRATFGDIPQARQREVVDRNRRIGVGFTGYHGFIALRWGLKYSESHRDERVKSLLILSREVVKGEAKRYSEELNIVTPVKNTALAPVGTVSAMPGVTSSGQAMDFTWFKRLVRYSNMDPELAIKREEGYEVISDPDAADTSIVTYWCEHPLVSKVKAGGYDPLILENQQQVPFKDSLEVQAMFQTYYADNAISFTVNLPPDVQGLSEEEMERQLFEVLPRLKGTTLYVDKSRKNAPFQALTKEEFDAYTGRKQITMVEDACVNGCPVV